MIYLRLFLLALALNLLALCFGFIGAMRFQRLDVGMFIFVSILIYGSLRVLKMEKNRSASPE